MSGPQFIRPQSTELSGLGEMRESYYKLQWLTVHVRATAENLSFRTAMDSQEE